MAERSHHAETTVYSAPQGSESPRDREGRAVSRESSEVTGLQRVGTRGLRRQVGGPGARWAPVPAVE